MTRRENSHDYTRPGIYHITIHVADGMGQLLGKVVPIPPKDATVSLTPIGQMVEQELLSAITAHYEMITIDAYVVMPEHLHFILIVRDPIVSKSGRPTHLGQVIAGFKYGCSRRFWAMTGQHTPTVEPQGTLHASAPAAPAATAPAPPPASARPLRVFGGSTAEIRTASGRPSLFSSGYCDVIPIEPGQLETQRAYIHNNPRSRWLRSQNRSRLVTQRGGIDTALTPSALCGYLRRECTATQATPEALSQIEYRLLLAGGKIDCDTYGDRSLLQRKLLPVVCHRKDTYRRAEQKQRCLDAAAQGAVLVSPRIHKDEQAIIDEAVNGGFAAIIIADNGFHDRYHPSAERISLCNEGRLLLVTPWQYQYRPKDVAITVTECKAMNCIAQALCRLKDDWWQT